MDHFFCVSAGICCYNLTYSTSFTLTMRYRLLLLLILMSYSQDLAAPDLSHCTELFFFPLDLLNNCLILVNELIALIIHYYIVIIRCFVDGVTILIDILIILNPQILIEDLSSDDMMHYYRFVRVIMENISKFMQENECIWFMFSVTTNTFQHSNGTISRRLVTIRVTIIPIKRHAKIAILCLLPVFCFSVQVTADPTMEMDLQFLFTIFKCPGSSVVRQSPNNSGLNIVVDLLQRSLEDITSLCTDQNIVTASNYVASGTFELKDLNLILMNQY